ncbi:MAG: acyltransferase [Candidatus Bathyarchaeota archaeon]|nr:acyltransferase [Candidatus Bathyarchaeota archaeon]
MKQTRFERWEYPTFDEKGTTKWNWMCQYEENLKLGKNTDIGAFTYINAKYGVEIQEDVQIGSHCSIYSWSTIDNKKGKVTIKRGAKIGSHSVIMPGVTIGGNSVIGAFSFVNKNIPDNAKALGIPTKILKKGDARERHTST